MGYFMGDVKLVLLGGILGYVMPLVFFPVLAFFLYLDIKRVDMGAYAKSARDWAMWRILLSRIPEWATPSVFRAPPPTPPPPAEDGWKDDTFWGDQVTAVVTSPLVGDPRG